MAENPERASDPLFRPPKRRKVFRKRGVEGEENDENPPAVNALNQDSTTPEDREEDENRPLVKRPASKKHGIGFSSTSRQNAIASTEMAMVPFLEGQEDEIMQSDRFIKPTGRVGVVEDDRHLTAYVDSKLAEMRSTNSMPTPSTTGQATSTPPHDPATTHSKPQSSTAPPSTVQPAEGPRESPRKGLPHGSRSHHPRPRRPPPTKDSNSIARESIVDQILSESQVPLYDRAAPPAPPTSASTQDADEAAAEAFKAEFLAELEERKRRRPPAPPAGTKGAQASSGPKLGGSRSQREKMKEAKNAAK